MRLPNWNPKVCTLFGVPVHLHWTLFAFLVGMGVYRPDFITALLGAFVGVLIHEFGHVLAARWYGVPTQKVVLTPLGGVALIESMPRNARHEFAITLAGPLTSLLLAFWCAALGAVTYQVTTFFVAQAVVNLSLFAFNMLPLFPMDGGRLLRSGLVIFMEREARAAALTDKTGYVSGDPRRGIYRRATRWAVRTGQGLAAAVMVVGVLNLNIMLIFIMALVMYMAEGELRGTR